MPGRVLLGCALAGLVLVVGDVLYLSSSRERLQALEKQDMALEQQRLEKVERVASLEARTHSFEVTQQRFAGLLRSLSVASEVPALLEDVARLGAASGLAMDGIVLLDEQPRPLYIEQPLQMAVTGEYHDLATFLSAMAGLSRLVTVHEVALRTDGELLRLDLMAKTYRRTSQGAQPDESGPPVEQGPRFVYDSSGLRDPFRSPALQTSHTRGRLALAPDLTRPRGVLEGLAVEQFQMVGTLSRGVQKYALLRATSAVYRLEVGDYLGPNHGRVTAIYDDHVELVELFPDERGAWLERPQTLLLNVNS